MKKEGLNRKENTVRAARKFLSYFVILLYWEALLHFQLHSSLEDLGLWNILFMIPIAFLMSSLSGLFRFSRINDLIDLIMTLGVSLFYLINLIYYKTFGSLFSFSMMGAGGDAVTNFWWSMKSTLNENLIVIILFEVPALYILYQSLIKKKENGPYRFVLHIAMMVLAIVTWLGIVAALPLTGTADHSAYGAYHSRYIDTDTASAKLGILPNFIVEAKCSFFGSDDASAVLQNAEDVEIEELSVEKEEVILYNEYEGLNFSRLSSKSEDSTIKALCDYLASEAPSTKNEYTGLFEGYNLIYICAESFSRMAIDETVTPTLYKMANNGIVLDNYYNSFKNVTTNGEYAILTGLWPDVARQETNMGKLTGTMGQSIDKNMSFALGNMFNLSEDLQSRGYHNYLGNYYGRNRTLPNMGFDCKFMNDGMKFTTAWPASDLEMMEQSVDDYINDDRFVTYYMTFSGHGNYTTDNIMVYRNINTVNKLLDRYLPTSATGYLSANYELEKAMTYLLERLEEAGKLENTVIVLAGDHYPYYLTDYGFEALTGEDMDQNFESFRSTCIIYNAGLKKKIEVDTPCCNVDIIPTIYNLFNIRYDSRLYAGTDIFGDGFHVAQIYNKSFVTKYVKYNYSTGKAQWLVDTEEYDDELLDKYLESAINIVKNRYMMSIQIEESDFYEYVCENYDISSIREEGFLANNDIEEIIDEFVRSERFKEYQ
ncbi:MAG: sulfatase-like hydrolase/transferase [Erysipelotrichaceae bacterium]|nr:sulfatase-like hydrolase/transferase [Erysipelotrichaceae bacterium]